jgi:hypothetical protein
MENEYTILSGEAYTVKAETEEEALEKFFAYHSGQDCPCGKSCDCVDYDEALTEVI